jgi:hypothetical protein
MFHTFYDYSGFGTKLSPFIQICHPSDSELAKQMILKLLGLVEIQTRLEHSKFFPSEFVAVFFF